MRLYNLSKLSENANKFSCASENCGYLELSGPLGIFSNQELDEAYESFLQSSYSSLVVDFNGSYPDGSFYNSSSFDTFIPARMIEFKREVQRRRGNLFLKIGAEQRKSFELSKVSGAFSFCDVN